MVPYQHAIFFTHAHSSKKFQASLKVELYLNLAMVTYLYRVHRWLNPTIEVPQPYPQQNKIDQIRPAEINLKPTY